MQSCSEEKLRQCWVQVVDVDHSFVDLGTHTFWYTSGSSKNHLKMMLTFAACIKLMIWPWCLPLLVFIGGQYFNQYTMKLYLLSFLFIFGESFLILIICAGNNSLYFFLCNFCIFISRFLLGYFDIKQSSVI